VLSLNRKSPYTGISKTKTQAAGLGTGKSVANGQSAKDPNDEKGFVSESSSPGTFPTYLSNTAMSVLPINVDLCPLLDGIGHNHFVFNNDQVLNILYRDMYYFDPIAGASADMISSLPFSDFSIGNIQDKKIQKVFNRTLERLNLKTLMPELSIDYLVLGTFIGSLLYDRNSKTFSDIMPHPVETAEITSLPFYSQDPIIEIKFPASIKEVLSKKSPRIEALKRKFGHEIISKIMSGKLELDPLSTVYMPRRTFSYAEGTSYFKRILPIYLIEKNLFRGTMIESSRRQRGITHLTLGDGDSWEPTPDDMDFITELFMNADADPLGAIVATRLGVSVDEVRSADGFWKIFDITDATYAMKYKALGINESLLSGEATLNTMENSLSLFVDNLRSYRDMLTRKFFYNKVFPLISLINGYTITEAREIRVKESLVKENIEDTLSILQDGSSLLIPTVHWAKQLKPEGDSAYFDILDRLTQAGVPVPLRVIAAAGGFNIEDLLFQQEDDLASRENVAGYLKALAAIKAKFQSEAEETAGEGGGASGSFSGFSSDSDADQNMLKMLASDGTSKFRSSVLHGGNRRPGLVNRFEGTDPEIIGVTRTGKPKVIHNQLGANADANGKIIKSLRSHVKHRRSQLNCDTQTKLKP
jgi:hypothetical protein